MAMCTLATTVALERKARLDEITSFADDGLASDELANTCLRNIKRLAADDGLLQQVDRDEVVVEIVRVLEYKITAEAVDHTENALAIARMLTSQGWLVVQSDKGTGP